MPEHSKDKPPGIRKLLGNWRVKLSIFLIFCLNVELEVIPVILIGIFNLSGQALRITAGIWSSAEMGWWVYFTSWAPKEAGKLEQVAGAKEATSDFVEEVKEDASRKIEEFVEGHTVSKFDIERWKNSRLYVFSIRIIKAFGYTFGFLLVLFLSAVPFPGLWIPGLVLCRKNNWKFGYAALFVGNFLKNYFYAYIWEFLWPYRYYMVITVLLSVFLLYAYKLYKRLTWKDVFLGGIVYFSKNSKNHP